MLEVSLLNKPDSEKDIMKDWSGDINKPLVSVCCITYNHEQFIVNAIDSFLAQKTSFPFEIIIRDDCSTDNTTAIVQKYTKEYPNVIKAVIEKENQYSKGVGVLPASYKHAIGKYVAICEGDDFWISDNKLEIQANYMESNNAVQLSFHDAITINSQREQLAADSNNFTHGQRFSTKEIIGQWFIGTQTIMFKNNLEQDTFKCFHGVVNEDWAHQLVSSTKGEVHYISQLRGAYRKHKDSLSTAIGKDRTYRAIKLITLMDKFDDYSNYRYTKEIENKKAFFINDLVEWEVRRSQSTLTHYLTNPKDLVHKIALAIKKKYRRKK